MRTSTATLAMISSFLEYLNVSTLTTSPQCLVLTLSLRAVDAGEAHYILALQGLWYPALTF